MVCRCSPSTALTGSCDLPRPRIQPLSEALDDLYKEFNALKAHLGELTDKFTTIEAFIDEVKAGRASSPAPAPAPAPGPAPVPGLPRRKVIRKKVVSR